MVAGITVQSDGRAEAAFAKIPAWHSLGKVIPHAMTSIEASREGGIGWQVKQEPLYMKIEDGKFRLIPGNKVNIRDDNQFILGVVGKNYKIVQNWEAFDFLDDLVQNEVLRYEAVFSLSGGKRVVMLARMPGTDPIVDGDNIEKFILFVNSHDGTSTIKVLPTGVRVVCLNTLRLALGIAKKEEVLAIKHSGDIKRKLDRARHILGIVQQEFGNHIETARKMTKVQLNAAQWGEYLDKVLPIPDDATSRIKNSLVKARTNISMIYNNDPTNTELGIQETAWAALNAVTHHVDHSKPGRETKSGESKFNSTTFGSGNDLKQRAWARAAQMVA